MLTDDQERICKRVLNVYETGTPAGNYSAISIYADGPNGIRQITYGGSQTTEYGNLRELVEMYANAGGTYSSALGGYVARIGSTPLTDDAQFKNLLRSAGSDPVMQRTQDEFFDKRYFQPALSWASNHGFAQPLAILVIYDSFIHSGSIPGHLRQRFPEKPPSDGGDEKTWIKQYVDARDEWLRNHSNPILHPTVYRTQDFKREITKGNWDLSALPFIANGTPVRAT